MEQTAVRVAGVGKRYHIGILRPSERLLYHRLLTSLTSPFLRFAAVLQGRGTMIDQEEFWALKDVSFEVKRGEVLGVVGRNGAGKSTLLKILARITPPTTGRVEIYGQAGSLLELGSAFNPELTGRENIYLQGTLYGRSIREVEKIFDEIVAFSEIEQFIDTQVKRYSSGMVGRLAFSIGAHIDCEILLLDEILATGDVMFSNKCLTRMKRLVTEGKTVIFVSHSTGAVLDICTRAILLEHGQIVYDGTPASTIELYLKRAESGESAKSATS